MGQLRAEYKKQAHLGDVIVPVVSRQDDILTVSLCSGAREAYAVVELKRSGEID